MWLVFECVATARVGFQTWIWSTGHCELGQGVVSWFQWWKKLDLSLFFLNWTGVLTWSLLPKLPPWKLELWFVLWSLVLFSWLFIAMNLPDGLCMEYCCNAWIVALSWYLDILDKLQKQLHRMFGPTIAASLESLVHSQNVASLSFSYSGNVHLNWLNWFHFLIFLGGQLDILIT